MWKEKENKKELDCLRYFVDGTTESLFEKWFYWDDLGVQLAPVIKEFSASEQYRTGRPLPGTIQENPPYHPDPDRQLENPFCLKDWFKSNEDEIHREGQKRLFDNANYQSDVIIYGKGIDEFQTSSNEIWLWQLVHFSKFLFYVFTKHNFLFCLFVCCLFCLFCLLFHNIGRRVHGYNERPGI